MSLFDIEIQEIDLSLLTFAEIAQLDAFRIVHTPATLPALFAAHGVKVFDVARALGVPFELVQRIVDRRQPLPVDLAHQLAAFLGESFGTVQGCAGLVTPITGPLTRIPLAPNPDLGESFPVVILGETQPLPVPSGGTPELVVYVCGAGLANDGADSGALRIGRNTGLIYSRAVFAHALSPAVLATDGSSIFTAGHGGVMGNYATAVLNAQTGALLLETEDLFYVEPLGVAWEPVTGTPWLCSAGATADALVQTNDGGISLHTMTLSDGVHDFSPTNLLAHGGLLYVVARRVDGGTQEGRLFEVDPVARAVLRTSTGADLLSAYGMAFDANAGVFLVTSANASGSPGPQIAKVVLSSFVASVVTLSGDPETLGNPTWVTRAHGSWWVTDQTALHGSRLFSMSTAGAVLQNRNFGGSSTGGQSAADPWFLWYADAPHGKVHVLDPADIGTSPATIDVGGGPVGLLVLSG